MGPVTWGDWAERGVQGWQRRHGYSKPSQTGYYLGLIVGKKEIKAKIILEEREGLLDVCVDK